MKSMKMIRWSLSKGMSDEMIVQNASELDVGSMLGVNALLKEVREGYEVRGHPDDTFYDHVGRVWHAQADYFKSIMDKEEAQAAHHAAWKERCASGKCKHGWCIQKREA